MKSLMSRRWLIAELILILSLIAGIYILQHNRHHLPVLSENNISSPTKEEAVLSAAYDRLPSETFFPPENKNDHQPLQKHTRDFTTAPGRPMISPVPSNNILPTFRTVEAGAGENITTRTRSMIQIPPNAFVDKDGNRVTGKVDVSYREFHNTWDMFVSGIPMHYDSAGYDLLESAGMIELNATQNGQPVFVNPDRQINVLLASANSSDGFNVYYYDKKNNQWAFQATNTMLWQEEPKYDKNDPEKKIYQYSSSNYYGYVAASSEMKAKRNFLIGPKRRPDYFVFNFPAKRQVFPELKALKNVNWTYKGDDATHLYDMFFADMNAKKAPVSFIRTENLRIEKRDSGYTMSFMFMDSHFEIAIEPFIRSEKDEKNFEKAFEQYQLKMVKRNDEEKKHFASFQRNTAEANAKLFANAKKFTNERRLLRTLAVNQFGMWNCDKPLTSQLPVVVKAVFVDEDGNKLPITNGYMVMSKTNSMINISDVSKFRFNPKSDNIFWAVLEDESIAIVYPKEFRRHENQRNQIIFTVKLFDDISDSKEALKKELTAIGRANV